MRTTLSLDDELLASVKLVAARNHRTIGSVVEDALRRFLTDEATPRTPVELPDFAYRGSVLDGVDLYDKESMARVLGEAGR